MWSVIIFILTAQLLCGCWVVPVESQITENRPIRHTLPTELESGLFGSPVNGGCSSVSGEICNGTSVLNDGNLPVLRGVQDMPPSTWANELFTMNRSNNDRIVVSVEIPIASHNRMQLTVFNCPQRGIYAPWVAVYIADQLRIVGPGDPLGIGGMPVMNVALPNISCEHLLKFCVQLSIGNPFLNLVFPYQNNSDFVFLGEVTFLNDRSSNPAPCGPPELITMSATPLPTTTDTSTDTTDSTTSTSTTSNTDAVSQSERPPSINPLSDQTATITAVVVVVVLVLIALIIVLVILIFFFMKRRRKQETDRVHQLQNVVMETEEKKKQDQGYVDGPDDYNSSVNKPPKNGVKVGAGTVIAINTLYSNPAEVKNETYSHLRDGEKRELTQVNSGASDDQYSKLSLSQNDPITTNTRSSPNPQEDEGVMYAVPDKKKWSDKSPAVPEKSSELVEYLEIKDAKSKDPILPNVPQHSEIDNSNKRSGSVGPMALSNTASHDLLSGLSSNPLYHSTDIRPLHMMPTLSMRQSQVETCVLEVNAIYAEPLPPSSTHEPEWNPDQNIYESIYSEPLNPSLFMQNRDPVDVEELRPYMSIYTVPTVPSTDKPLSVSIANIKEIKHLGDGNFGQVVLAQTVGLTPRDLRLEGNAPYSLVAVKKLKTSASNRNRQLFNKEVSFMSRLNHPNVIRLLGVCSEGAVPFIMMEYMTNGDLNQYLHGFNSISGETSESIKSISISTLIYMSTQIASAMQYLASQNFVHRDLATRNCLVGSKDTIKISDFGMSRSLYESQYYVISGHAILPIRWMATECFFGKFSAKTDVWAFGVTMWEIFTLAKEQPYNHLQDREVVEDAVKGPNRTLLKQPAECPGSMYEIMSKCWVHDGSKRPTFDELFNLLSKS